MKDLIDQLDKLLENRVRLGIMSLLVVNDQVDFLTLKKKLGQTDGNLASHITKLEKAEYLTVQKKFVGKKTQTDYKVTPIGKKAFENHLTALEKIIKGGRE